MSTRRRVSLDKEARTSILARLSRTVAAIASPKACVTTFHHLVGRRDLRRLRMLLALRPSVFRSLPGPRNRFDDLAIQRRAKFVVSGKRDPRCSSRAPRYPAEPHVGAKHPTVADRPWPWHEPPEPQDLHATARRRAAFVAGTRGPDRIDLLPSRTIHPIGPVPRVGARGSSGTTPSSFAIVPL